MGALWGNIIDGAFSIVAAILAAAVGAVISARITQKKLNKRYEEGTKKLEETEAHLRKLTENEVHLSRDDENIIFFQEACKAKRVCLYTVNSYKWANIFQNQLATNPNIFLNEIVIMIRKKDNESQAYLDDLNNIIKIWKKLKEDNRIKKLSIYGYKNDPDHYYAKFGDSVVLTGHVYVDDDNISGTQIDLRPIVITREMNDGKEIIERYEKHFSEMIDKNKENIIFEA